jgi:integrase
VTLAEFTSHFVAFSSTHCKPTTLHLYADLLERFIVPRLGSHDLRRITTADVVGLHSSLAGTPVQANRALMVTMRLLKVARLHGYRTQQVEKPPRFAERSRTRFLTPAEAADLLRRLAAEPSIAARAISLMLLTGLRRGEALGLRWTEVDLDRRLLVLVDSKTGTSIRPLSREAARLLAGLPRIGEYVFPGGGTTGRLVAVERTWRRVRREAGLDGTGVCLHTLRHSFASLAVSAGVPLYTVGKALGHKTPSMTARYAHCAPAAMQQASEAVSAAIGTGGPAK